MLDNNLFPFSNELPPTKKGLNHKIQNLKITETKAVKLWKIYAIKSLTMQVLVINVLIILNHQIQG